MLAPQRRNVSPLQTVAQCLVQTEVWMRSRFNSLVCPRGSSPSFGPCFSHRQRMFQNVGRLLFSSSSPLSEGNTHHSLPAFQSCSYGNSVKKRNYCEILQKIEKYSVLEKYKNSCRSWDQHLVLFSECLLIFVCSLYHMMTLWVHQMQKMSSMFCINTLNSGFNYADENQMAWYLAVQCFVFFQICPRFSHRDLSNIEGPDSSPLSLLPCFSFSPGLWSVPKMNGPETQSELNLFLQKSKGKVFVMFIKLELGSKYYGRFFSEVSCIVAIS